MKIMWIDWTVTHLVFSNHFVKRLVFQVRMSRFPSTARGKAPLARTNHYRPSTASPTASPGTFERLARPKMKDKRWIPDRPSVYWLDYIIDPTPHKITNPEELMSYYECLQPKFPRMQRLSTPRPYYGTMFREDEDERHKASLLSGVPVSALSYEPTERIKILATPKTKSSREDYDETGSKMRSSSSKRSLSSGRSLTPQGKGRYFDPHVDLARGDFASRSKHGIHTSTSKERTLPPVNDPKSRTRSLSNHYNAKPGQDDKNNVKRRPMSRNPYSLKN
ncbi:Testicular haploid expressed protein [Orchesella cincta]|uniref:Testicular haploid expressed protein n=1 Tax=Orchesella cincta TaxID=48709 RepID=A0A1D2NKP2_ORCCI|nr:Testicular haploid expressed protein [Orchesella cincta]